MAQRVSALRFARRLRVRFRDLVGPRPVGSLSGVPDRRLRHLLRRRDPLLPPPTPQGRRAHEFRTDGDELLLALARAEGVTPVATVLDVGCGYGLFARPLTGFLVSGGRYTGVDVDADAVAWCRTAYTEYERFGFVHADLANAFYRPDGAAPAIDFCFPADDASVDVVVMATVLAHLVTAEVGHYVREAARVLRPGGRLLAGMYLLDYASRAAIGRGQTTPAFDLAAAAGPMLVVDPELPEEAVAYDHAWFEQITEQCGLRQVEATPGSWRGGLARLDRDLVVLECLT